MDIGVLTLICFLGVILFSIALFLGVVYIILLMIKKIFK
ncbi:hypothetical protein [Sigmofec virus UA08Rod_6926]|uniref:Uncharacterized protein n=1 Tax=Sigmofec virus UA08Rod_6926 TaxID=2929241 RepID=A0A976N0A2_9VIRU|nr:hypothetical protein [Sigmofec virus UA08Rod_6926]